MKYLVALLVGMLAGIALFLALLYYNPLNKREALSPLSVSEHEVAILNYSAVAADSLIYTNDGESRISPHPAKVLQLWEAPVRKTTAQVSVLSSAGDQPVGIGVKFSSESESTDILNGKLITDSVWHIYLPERGSFFMTQTENYWNYFREIVVRAYRSSGDNWRGQWIGQTTTGPGALGTARVVGGSGDFESLESDAVERLTAKAYSVDKGPVALTGELAVEIPEFDEPELEATPGP